MPNAKFDENFGTLFAQNQSRRFGVLPSSPIPWGLVISELVRRAVLGAVAALLVAVPLQTVAHADVASVSDRAATSALTNASSARVTSSSVRTGLTGATTASCLDYANQFDSSVSNISPGPAIAPYTSAPAAVDAWFNSTDVEERGIYNPNDQRPWKFAQQFARLLCYSAPNADITAAYYFFRATNASDTSEFNRPESDSETVFRVLQWLAENRNVKTEILLDNTNTCTTNAPTESCSNIMTKTARAALEKRFTTIPGSTITYCINGCFNTARYGVYPYAIEHEKFFTVSDTDFPGAGGGSQPLVISTSANLARSQVRNYRQEAASIYDDQVAWQLFSQRFKGMQNCALNSCSYLGSSTVYNTNNPNLATTTPNPLGLVQEDDRRIWVDPILRHTTDVGRGTSVSFSPGRNADVNTFDVYVNQFDNVDCDTDGKIRVAMFKLTDAKAEKMAAALKSLTSRGCDVKMLMTSEAGSTIISTSVRNTLSAAGVDYKCAVDGMHTKLILIGPNSGNLGSVLTGTQNMSVSGQLYNEEHVVTFDARKATGASRAAIRSVYDDYQHEWFELSRGASKNNCGAK